MTETFYFDFNQIAQTGVNEVELGSDYARADGTYGKTAVRRPSNMKMSNFGALDVGNRLSSDYTRVNTMAFKSKGESEDVNVLTEDSGLGQNVRLFNTPVNHNPNVWGSSVKFTRDDQFIRMSMSKESGAQIDLPSFDVMDSKESTAAGIIATTNYSSKNWPAEGWHTFGSLD